MFAPRTTRLVGQSGGNTAQLENSEPVSVWGFTVTNKSTSSFIVQIRKADDANTVFYHQRLAGSSSFTVDIKFIADKGIDVVFSGTSPQDGAVTFFHNAPGS